MGRALPSTRPLLVGHRANTARWALRLLSEGATGLEIDVHVSRGVVVAGHPREAGRPRLVRERLGSLISSLRLTPPTPLERLLALLPAGLPVFLDVKQPAPSPEALAPIAERWRGRLVVVTRLHDTIPALSRLGLEAYASLDHRPYPGELEALAAAGASGLSVRHTYIDERLSTQARSLRLRLAAWTVNEPGEARRLLGLVDEVVTDVPALLRRPLG